MLCPMTRRAALMLAAWLAAAVEMLAGTTLTRLVPADAGLCLTLEDAATHADRFLASPLFARLREYPPLAEWRREHGPPLKRIAGDVSRQLGVEVDDAWRRAFGRQALLAVWPPDGPDQKQGPGLLLVEADDAELLSRLVAGIRSAQQRSGDVLDSRHVTYRGLEYEERRIKRGTEDMRIYLAVLDRIGVLASQEDLIERVLDLHLTREVAGARLAQLPAFQTAMTQVDPAAPAKLFVNPRSWDAALAHSLPDGKSGLGQQFVTQAWRSLEYAVFAFSLHPQASAEGFLALQNHADASHFSEVGAALSGPASLLEQIPADALAAATGQVDVTRLIRWVHSGDAPDAPRKRSLPEVIWSLVDGTFQGLGPGFGGFLAAPPADSEFPLAAAAGMQIQNRVAAQPDHALKPADALRSLLQAAVALSPPRDGQSPPQLKSHAAGETEVLTLVDLAGTPPGLSPSFAFSGRTMFVGTGPQVVQRAATLAPAESLAAASVFRTLLGPRLKHPTHASYANLAALRRWLAADGDRIAAALSGDKEGPPDEARRGLEQLSSLLEVADVAAAAVQIEPSGIRLVATAAVEDE